MIQLIAALILLQQPTAEETFNQIEESLFKAKTVSVKYRFDMVQGEQKGTRTGVVLLKEGNKVKITADFESAGQKSNAWVLSDGQRMRSDQRQGDVDHSTESDTPRTLRNKLTTVLVRWGCLDIHSLSDRIDRGYDPKEALVFKDVKFGAKDGEDQTLTYAAQAGTSKVELKLWYDPKALTLKKRTFSIPEQKVSFTETYEEFTLNGEIPDATFQLPKK